ncbi:2,3-dihydro-2,3-dihydroxybenzoate dehydrogenase [Nonomuraea ceibae]|uniref:2,3-dihydro-2,3-dihydroxybenzoate dehydrogenase n=1 Tax=Nonomuraea ceibae TaxID=1935170 RepID=UPI001C5F80C8|nr:2,3-dihydro-2,3-dihydroxybenzoate dehydrogenase [Nonomuraea ceibae]
MVALVTGAAGGIGSAICHAFASAGARVAAVDMAKRPLRELTAVQPRLTPYAADVSDEAAVDAVVTAVERELGPITVCVHAAGVLSAAPVVDTTAAQWRAMFAVNAEATFAVARAVARVMIPRRRGVIITVASNAASLPRADLAAYAASKAAAAMFTRCLGLELAPYGIRCNVVAPGSTDTAMLRATGQDPAAAIAGAPERWRLGIPLGRVADPGDIAAAVTFLASDQARHITMQSLTVDGGASLTG